MSTRCVALLAATCALSGCEYAFSDVATRVRYALASASSAPQSSSDGTSTLTLSPDHWPDDCDGTGYRLRLTPDRGEKQVATGDIWVTCGNRHEYYTGLGSEQIYVTEELAIDKRSDESVSLMLRKTPKGTEIVALK